MIRFRLFALSVTLALAACSPFGREVSVKDVTHDERIVVRQRPGQGPVTGISIRASGSITGNAEIQLMLNGSIYKRERLSGLVSFQWDGDWYADAAEVHYVAGTASGGTVTLTYRFH